jgi:signal transduction histidine kinase
VFLNLILNAVQAMGEGGTLKLCVEPAGHSIRVTVGDSGPGIEPEKLKRIFEPFFSTKPGGTGLGLPIAQQIVAEHGGRLVLESSPGHGTTATVFLPGSVKRDA